LEETVPDYFSGGVLLRADPSAAGAPGLARSTGCCCGSFCPERYQAGELRFQSLFNIIVVWMAVFIGLSKGIF